MEDVRQDRVLLEAVSVLPAGLRQVVLEEGTGERVEELRLRMGYPAALVVDGTEQALPTPPVTGEELEYLLDRASGSSMHLALDQLRRGYLTIPGGHRIGFCGRAVMEGGELVNLRPLSSACLRVARERPGIAGAVLPRICPGGRLTDTLILAPPGLGKTTLLRDVIRACSMGEGCAPLRVALADERGEVAAVYEGVPQLDVGPRTDVLEGCPKGMALSMLLRAMAPQVLAVDEITEGQDLEAMSAAVGCGVTLLATAHGRGMEDLEARPIYRRMLELRLFRRVVYIGRSRTGRKYQVEELE